MTKLQSQLPEDSLHIGKLGKTFGLKGGLHFYGLSPAENTLLTTLPKVFVDTVGTRKVLHTQAKGKNLVLFLERVNHINYARPLVNSDVYAFLEDVPEDDDTLYTDALLELAVFVDGTAFGEVIEVMAASSQDILVISSEDGAEHLVPLQADYVTVDENGIQINDAPEGLLEPPQQS